MPGRWAYGGAGWADGAEDDREGLALDTDGELKHGLGRTAEPTVTAAGGSTWTKP